MSATARLADPLAARYTAVRVQTEALCRPLAVEDYGVQPMVDASPPKWHLAHTTTPLKAAPLASSRRSAWTSFASKAFSSFRSRARLAISNWRPT